MILKEFFKKYRWPILIVVGVLLSGGVVVASIKEVRWLVDLLTFLGIVVSFCGLMVTLGQVDSVKKTANKTKDAVLDNRKEIRKFLAFSDVGHLVEKVKHTQIYIRENKFEIANIYLKEIKDCMIRGRNEWELNELIILSSESENESETDKAEPLPNEVLQNLTATLRMDIESVEKHLFYLKHKEKDNQDGEDSDGKEGKNGNDCKQGKDERRIRKSTLKPQVIMANLEKIREFLVGLETDLKGNKI